MIYRIAADLTVVVHLAFILVVVLGGLAVLRWPWMALLHLPTAAWGAWIEITGGVCPLTTLENRLRALAGQEGYTGGFIDHYLVPVIYPPGLTRAHQLWIAGGVLALNLVVYSLVLRRLHG